MLTESTNKYTKFAKFIDMLYDNVTYIFRTFFWLFQSSIFIEMAEMFKAQYFFKA